MPNVYEMLYPDHEQSGQSFALAEVIYEKSEPVLSSELSNEQQDTALFFRVPDVVKIAGEWLRLDTDEDDSDPRKFYGTTPILPPEKYRLLCFAKIFYGSPPDYLIAELLKKHTSLTRDVLLFHLLRILKTSRYWHSKKRTSVAYAALTEAVSATIALTALISSKDFSNKDRLANALVIRKLKAFEKCACLDYFFDSKDAYPQKILKRTWDDAFEIIMVANEQLQPCPFAPATSAATAPKEAEAPSATPHDKITLALALLAKNPGWTTKKIAKEVPCDRSYLAKNPKFLAARQAQKPNKKHGYRNIRTGDIDVES
jgi:hypothetical protein